MNIFDEEIVYFSSYHAEEQLVSRSGCSPDVAKGEVIKLAQEGELLIEVNDYRYIKNGDFFLPCVHYAGKPRNYYRVKSVLTWDMVDYRLQNVIDNYHLYTHKS